MELEATSDSSEKFAVFIRQSSVAIDGFSIGLRYRTLDDGPRTITLTRYNGPHGEYSRHPDQHYAQPHIHRITADELEKGLTQPRENYREITQRYNTFEQALAVFFQDINAANYQEHFPDLRQLRLLNGHQ